MMAKRRRRQEQAGHIETDNNCYNYYQVVNYSNNSNDNSNSNSS